MVRTYALFRAQKGVEYLFIVALADFTFDVKLSESYYRNDSLKYDLNCFTLIPFIASILHVFELTVINS